MSTDFLRSNPKLDEAIASADNFEALREFMLTTLASQGTISRDRADAYGVRVLKAPEPEPTQPAAAPDLSGPASQNCIRVIYPHGNDRYEIYGASESELDAKEEQIRRSYGK